jgi:hypothetical protein
MLSTCGATIKHTQEDHERAQTWGQGKLPEQAGMGEVHGFWVRFPSGKSRRTGTVKTDSALVGSSIFCAKNNQA